MVGLIQPVNKKVGCVQLLFDAADLLGQKYRMTTSDTWTDDRIDRLKAYWGMGFSATAIANHLEGVSRNAVIGKAKRLGLPKSPIEERLIRLSKAILAGETGDAGEGLISESVIHSSDKHAIPKPPARDGQSAFRAGVLARYKTCVITGCSTEMALQAAHIVPYYQSKSQSPERGILLRADIHSLFDAGLIAIAPISHTVLASSQLTESDYSSLAGLKAHFSENTPPDTDLAWHLTNVFQSSGTIG